MSHTKQIGVYWDFENIHASVYEALRGKQSYSKGKYTRQPAIVNIPAIMEYIAGQGEISVNKAYANWGPFNTYKNDFLEFTIDLIQLFPRGAFSKNGADIRMSIDIIEDINLNPHINCYVLIGGDSDYISVAQKVRQKGKYMIGIGAQESSNQYWVKACNEFKFYKTLVAKAEGISEADAPQFSNLENDKDLLVRAMKQLIAKSDDDHVHKAALKPMMTRLDPTFDEGNYGYDSFSKFIADVPDILEIVPGKHDHLLRLRH